MSGSPSVQTRRREMLAAGGGALSLVVARPARATPESMAGAIQAFVGGAEVRKGRVTLDIPPLVENGNSVPLTVTVESPMTAAGFREDHRHLQRDAIRSRTSPLSISAHGAGRAIVSTRIRLGILRTSWPSRS